MIRDLSHAEKKRDMELGAQLRKGDTDICGAIDSIMLRLNTLRSDRLFGTKDDPVRDPETDPRIPLQYRTLYEGKLRDALHALVQVEGRYLKQRDCCRKQRAEAARADA